MDAGFGKPLFGVIMRLSGSVYPRLYTVWSVNVGISPDERTEIRRKKSRIIDALRTLYRRFNA